ncbi:MAG: hypothetical protein QM758_21375 [Armatimonas sp.]
MMQANSFSKHIRHGLRGLLSTAELGMRHGPRLGVEVGAAAGSFLPIIGTAAGAFVGLVVGGPLGILMGLVGGVINRRWGWALGGALPGGLLALSTTNAPDSWIVLPGSIACICGGVAGYRLGKALEISPEDHFERFQASAKSFLSPTPFWIRLGLCVLFFWTLTDLGYTVVNGLSHLGETQSTLSANSR